MQPSCYFFDPPEQHREAVIEVDPIEARHGFQSLLNGHESDYLVNLRHEKFISSYAAVEDIVQSILKDYKENLYNRVINHISEELSQRAIKDTKLPSFLVLPTAVVTLGTDIHENQAMGTELTVAFNKVKTNRAIFIDSRQHKSLKSLIPYIVESLTEEPSHANDFDTLVNYLTSETRAHELRLIFVFHFLEDFKNDIMDDFLTLLKESLSCCYFSVGLVIFSTLPSWNIHELLSPDALCLLSIEDFQPSSSIEIADTIILKVFVQKNLGFHIGWTSLRYILQQFNWIHFSLSTFTTQLQFCILDYYYNNPLSVLSVFGTRLEHLDPILDEFDEFHYEKIRMNPSFQQMIESQIHVNSRKVLQLLNQENIFKTYLPITIKNYLNYLYHFSLAFQSFLLLEEYLISQSYKKPKYELFYMYLEGSLIHSEVYETVLKNLRSMTLDNIKQFLSNVIDLLVKQDSEVGSQTDNIEVLRYLLSCYSGNDLPSAIKSRDPLKNIYEFFRSFFEINMKPYFETEGHEIFYYDHLLSIRKTFNPNPKAAIQNALLNPHHYLECSCCDGSMKSSLPDISILYKIYLEFGRWINLHDWMVAFSSQIGYHQGDHEEAMDDACEKTKEILTARFLQGISELHFLGFIKMAANKKDFAFRLTFDSFVIDE